MSEDNCNDEWQSWQEAWQDPAAEPPPSPELAARLAKAKSSHRFGLGLLALTAAELLVCIGTLVFFVYYVVQKPTPWRLAMFVLAFVLVTVAQILTLKNRRGTWRPQNQTTQAFVELEWLRAQRQLRTIRFMMPFFVVELISIAALRLAETAFDPARAGRLPKLTLHLAIFGLASYALLALGSWLWRRRIRRKMKELEPLRAAFAPPSDRL